MLGEVIAVLLPQISNRAVEVLVIDNCPDASARETVLQAGCSAIRYIHEPKSGVVNARNRGVVEAAGTYVIFLDDDEVPCPGWLDAWLTQANNITDMAFGRIVPRLLGACPQDLAGQVDRAYSRQFSVRNGADISAKWPYLGTGNAMFHKARCFADKAPFDQRFNSRGGEDVWLIRSLIGKGRKALWNHDSLVEELVPKERMTLPFAKARKFNQGQLRCILMYGDGGIIGGLRVAVWMMIGAIQLLMFGLAARFASVLAPTQASDFRCRASGGAGKLLWWSPPRTNNYSKA